MPEMMKVCAQRKAVMPRSWVRFPSVALLLLMVGVAPAPALAQRETEYERQTREDQQDTRNRIDQAARIAKMHDDIAAQFQAERDKAAAQPKAVAGIRFQTVKHQWSVRDWSIVALPNHECDALLQKRTVTPFNFWGFRVKDGSDVQMYFGSIANAQPQQITYNDGPPNTRTASVERFGDWNAYVVPLKLEDLWAFPDELDLDAYVGGAKVSWGTTKLMGKVAEALEKCDNWQDAH
jgi:hypothetical protein